MNASWRLKIQRLGCIKIGILDIEYDRAEDGTYINYREVYMMFALSISSIIFVTNHSLIRISNLLIASIDCSVIIILPFF